MRHQVGVDRIMWGSDFPHREGCWPYSHEHLRLAFAGVDRDEVAAMVGGNAADVYGFDLDALAPVAARIGPPVDEVAKPLAPRRHPDRGAALPDLRRRGGRARASRRAHPDTVKAGGRSWHASAMGARTPEQLENREVKATSVGAWSTSLTAIYETDPDVVAAVLPPPLEPTDEPLVRVSVARGRPGRGAPAVRRRHLRRAGRATKGQVGNYPLVMPMTTEQSVIGGRETFGEPKKLAEVTLERDGDRVVGRVARLGTTFIEVAGTVVEELPVPDDLHRVDFYFKFLPAPGRQGLRRRARPRLLPPQRDGPVAGPGRGDGDAARVALRPGRRPARAAAGEPHVVRAAQRADGEIVSRVPGEWIAPYAHQRYDDLSPVGERLRPDDRRPGGQGRRRHRRRQRHRPRHGRAVRPRRHAGGAGRRRGPGARRDGRRAARPRASTSPGWSPTCPTTPRSRRCATPRSTPTAPSTCCATTPGWAPGAEGHMWDHTLNDWRWALEVNVWGVIHGIKAFVPAMVAGSERRPCGQHLVGQRRHRPAARHAHLRAHQVGGRDAQRVAVRPAQPGGARVGASVLFPGPHMLRTGLFESWRNRPPERANATPGRRRPPPSTRSRSAWPTPGIEVTYTPVEEVADRVADAVRRRHVLDPAAVRQHGREDQRPGAVDARPRQPDLHDRPDRMTG